MKKFLFLICLLLAIPLFAQVDRTEIEGNIRVPEGMEAGGITVYNLNSNRGAVTDDDGNFEIAVKLDDSLAISALQYQKFIVIIDKGVLDSESLNITVREAVTELDEVIVRPYDLSGNVSVDVQKVEIFENPLEKTSEEITDEPYNPPADQRPVKNIAMDDPYLKHGLNFVNIFKAIFNSDNNNVSSNAPRKDIETKVRELYEDEFFQEYIGIEKENINEFIFFAKKNGLDDEMMQSGHELDLIEFLIEQGNLFKLRKNTK
ncbi:MAG TPA: carboxypeptidase-like regulatory domain-containing protein [Flavobacteriaceae bacterium]|nr:carboxypeptidase-like regulatory domain-containing protein [Flavobacteriaceae bacterium]